MTIRDRDAGADEEHRLSLRQERWETIGRCGCGQILRADRSRGAPRKQIRDAHRTHIEAARDHAIDLKVDCSTCQAVAGVECLGLARDQVHGARRVRRLLAGWPMTSRTVTTPETAAPARTP